MPSDEYSSAPGGTLKLKGVKGSKVEKHDKKKKKKKKKHDRSITPEQDKDPAAESDAPDHKKGADKAPASETDMDVSADEPAHSTKTEAERRHEERRRKMLDERLQREGIKTHKERVEELNRYLSNLSEHHDMPRIGPG